MQCDYNGEFAGSLVRNGEFGNRENPVGIPLQCDYNGELAGSFVRNDDFCGLSGRSEFALYDTKRFARLPQRPLRSERFSIIARPWFQTRVSARGFLAKIGPQ